MHAIIAPSWRRDSVLYLHCSRLHVTSLQEPLQQPRCVAPYPLLSWSCSRWYASVWSSQPLQLLAAVAQLAHPELHLMEPDAVAPVPLHISGGSSKTLILIEAVWNCGWLLPPMKHGMRGALLSTSCTVLTGTTIVTCGCKGISCSCCEWLLAFVQEGMCFKSFMRIWASSSMSLSGRGPW